jgi:hypothetical protein
VASGSSLPFSSNLFLSLVFYLRALDRLHSSDVSEVVGISLNMHAKSLIIFGCVYASNGLYGTGSLNLMTPRYPASTHIQQSVNHCHRFLSESSGHMYSKKLGRVGKDRPTGINLRRSLGFPDRENPRTLAPS